MLAQQFFEYVETILFPSSLQSLKQCKETSQILIWNQRLIKELTENKVQDEQQDNEPVNLDPQEESKEELPMPQKIFNEAKALFNEQRALDLQHEKEKDLLKQQQEYFEEGFKKFGSIKQKSSLQYIANLNDEIATNAFNLAQTQKITSDAADKVISVIRAARAKICPSQNLNIMELGVRPVVELKLKIKYADSARKDQAFQHPKCDDLSYDNHIVGLFHKPGDWNGFNIIMSNGNNSTLQESKGKLVESRIPQGSVIRKVIMWASQDTENRGFQFLDRDGNSLLGAGSFDRPYQREIVLQDGERLIGVKSAFFDKSGHTRLSDFQFIIGWLE